MTSLAFDVFWRDHGATKGARDLGDNVEKTKKRFGAFQAVAATAGVAVGAALFSFGRDSAAAFKESAAAQARLSDAFAKFPALADTNKGALDRLNTALARKTGIDDDATASGQAVLAQFKLTGEQIIKLTPLLQDYATKTGKDLPTAAQDLGKAILGQGRALKTVGLDFQDTGTAAGNFDQLVSGLTTQVGDFATKGLDPAALKSKILHDRFEELQEKIGGKLVPVLQKLTEVGISASDWVDKHSKLVVAAGIAVAGFVVILGTAKVATLAWRAAQIVATAATTAWTAAIWLGSAATKAWISLKFVTIIGSWIIAMGAARIATIAWTAAQWLLNIALTANPVGAVIVAVGLLVAAIVLIATKTTWFQTIWRVAWDGIKLAARAAWAWIDKMVVQPMVTSFQKIKGFIDGIGRAWNSVKGFFSKINPFGGGGTGGLQSAFAGSGNRRFPLPGGQKAYRVTQGPHPVNAIDYAAPSGTPVFASFSGFLTTTDLGNRSYGKYFRLAGNGQKPILGAHLSAFARGSGPIAQGSLIGYTGTSGNSTGPHLHLENFDWGGILQRGWNLVRNDTGRPEQLRPVTTDAGASRGAAYNITVNVPPMANAAQVGREVVRAIQEYEKGSGRSWRAA